MTRLCEKLGSLHADLTPPTNTYIYYCDQTLKGKINVVYKTLCIKQRSQNGQCIGSQFLKRVVSLLPRLLWLSNSICFRFLMNPKFNESFDKFLLSHFEQDTHQNSTTKIIMNRYLLSCNFSRLGIQVSQFRIFLILLVSRWHKVYYYLGYYWGFS